MKKPFLVPYDYRTGGGWAYLVAEPHEQVEQRFPELRVVHERPSWLNEAEERNLRERMTIDIDDSENLFLAALLRGRRDV